MFISLVAILDTSSKTMEMTVAQNKFVVEPKIEKRSTVTFATVVSSIHRSIRLVGMIITGKPRLGHILSSWL